jgi:hypothetical protein
MEPPIASDDLMEVDLRRSGFIDWNYSPGTGDVVELMLYPLAWLLNWLTNLMCSAAAGRSASIGLEATASRSARPDTGAGPQRSRTWSVRCG